MKKKTSNKSLKLREILLERGYDVGLCEQITMLLNTDFTAERMLRYLDNVSNPKIEQLVDEMLTILAQREAYVKRQIADNVKHLDGELYLKGFEIDWMQRIEDDYVYEIEAILGIDRMTFNKNITFFVGENGSGKSTLLEALAVACGLNPEGGTWNYNFSTYDDHSGLSKLIKLVKGAAKPKWSYFLRAESFFNVASAALAEYNYDGTMPDYHARSHGESFMDFILSVKEDGLYFMDEPEAALSPQRQLALLVHLVKMAVSGSQFFIATHSPILLGIPDADIYSFDGGELHKVEYEETESYQITKLFLENRERMIHELLETEEEE